MCGEGAAYALLWVSSATMAKDKPLDGRKTGNHRGLRGRLKLRILFLFNLASEAVFLLHSFDACQAGSPLGPHLISASPGRCQVRSERDSAGNLPQVFQSISGPRVIYWPLPRGSDIQP